MNSPIVEVADAPQGLTEIKVRDSKGHRIGLFQVSSKHMDDEFAAAIVAWQARHDHRGLVLMHASALAG